MQSPTRLAEANVSRRRFLLGAGVAAVSAAVLGVALDDLLTDDDHDRVTGSLSQRATFGIDYQLRDSPPPNSGLLALEKALSYSFPLVGTFLSFDMAWSLARHPSLAQLSANRTCLMVAWMPKSEHGRVDLVDIAVGRYDAYLDQMLAGMRQYAGPVVVRFGHEMNGNWSPWSAAYTRAGLPLGGCRHPEDFTAAWRHIVERERALPGESNIRWFWCPSATDSPPRTSNSPQNLTVPLESYWPGSHWVDIVGADGYNEPGRWQWFDDVFAQPYERILKLAPTQSFWIGETGCHEAVHGHPGTKAEWLHQMFDSTQFERMQAVCYFDYNATSTGRADWSFSSSPDAFAAARHNFSRMSPRPVHL